MEKRAFILLKSVQYPAINKRKHILFPFPFGLLLICYFNTMEGYTYASQYSNERHHSTTFSGLLSSYISVVPPSSDPFFLIFQFPFSFSYFPLLDFLHFHFLFILILYSFIFFLHFVFLSFFLFLLLLFFLRLPLFPFLGNVLTVRCSIYKTHAWLMHKVMRR